jgi:hypothetical protein
MEFKIVRTTADNNVIYHLNNIPGFNQVLLQNPPVYDPVTGIVEPPFDSLKFSKIFCHSPNHPSYGVIRYDKHLLLNDDKPRIGLLRSVIVNSSGKVLSFAPPKSIDWLNFSTLHPEKNDTIVAEQFVEGTMINVFWDSTIGVSGAWEIATRSNVGAEIAFYHEPGKPIVTFRSMFMEALNETGLDFNKLNPLYSYSFVLQHPLNRIVVPFKKPALYLVALYEIVHTEGNIVNVTTVDMSLVREQHEIWGQTSVQFPEIYEDWKCGADLVEKYASMNTSYEVVGVIIKNLATGARSKIRNPVYENVRHLRGNQPKLMYQYLSLRQEGKVTEYLKYYPEHKKEFSFFREQLHKYTMALYQNYIDCYIKKEKPLREYTEKYRTHMYNIHQIYVNQLKAEGRHISNSVVIDYVNKVHPSLQMYALNYDMRKRQVDILEVDLEAGQDAANIV